jgi:transposase
MGSKHTDLRRLTHEELTEFRKQGVAAVQEGASVEEVCRGMGICRAALFGWLARYRSGGWDALRAGKRGGRKPKLDAAAMRWVYDLVTGRDPEQLKFPFALWTCALVGEAIRRELGIRLSRWSVMRLLRHLGLSPQRPLHRAYQQNAEAVAAWKSQVYPKIRREARKCGGEIYFADESSIRSDYHAGTTWAPKGKTPVVKSTGARFSINIIGAATARGKLRFRTFNGTMTAPVFIDFLRGLLRDARKPVFVIVDGHPVHRSAAVRDYVQSTANQLRLYFLPGYSPELNPVEQAWNHAKRHNVGTRIVTGPDQLRRLAISALRKLQKLPAVIMGFFRHPECAYAKL